MMGRIGRERGWPPLSRSQFDAGLDLRGHLVAGSPQQVIDKILFQQELFHHDRFLMQISVGPLPHKDVLRAIELLGTKVAPVVRREMANTAGRSRGLTASAYRFTQLMPRPQCRGATGTPRPMPSDSYSRLPEAAAAV